ncbi:MAG: TetR/AcrR family transcriptional regulator [Planctomycetes bacterium]|jgi:AcrR family transcriptional regulator|nr:TetR/AcrR family transcriptional regulator [Planctomycetota bacterium]
MDLPVQKRIESLDTLVQTPEPAPSRTEKRAAKTRNKLLKAALDIFSEWGVDAATIDMITERADLGKGTFYRHFTDKYDIAGVLVEQAIDHLLGLLRQGEPQPSRSLEDVLEHFLNAHYAFFRHHQDEFILLFQGRLLLKLERQATDRLEAPFARYLEEIEIQLVPYLGQKKVDLVRIRRLACAVAGFVFGFFSFAMIGMEPQDIADSIKPLRQSFVKSLTLFLTQ